MRKVGHPPLMSTLLQLTAPAVVVLLAFHTDWILETGSMPKEQAQWVFALLACIDKVMEADAMAMLRQLCRVCSQLAGERSKSRSERAAATLVVIIVTNNFIQRDLWQEHVCNVQPIATLNHE